ncbi:hypothetical protein [Flavobacterium sp.]|uniref:hypothetical protein n=1 Tax=Flavobacterium sp. TaxID=239 RepID=UPI0033427006
MKTHFLFPNQFKNTGWLIFVLSVLGTLFISVFNKSTDDYLNITVFSIYQDSIGEIPGFFKFIKNSIVDEILTVGIIVGGILVGFSKTKNEDEYISKIRYESLVWATYLNYGIVIFFTLFIYGLPYLNVLFYNMFTLLLFFIIRFHYMIYKLNKSINDDE